jgi:hypothetical protein
MGFKTLNQFYGKDESTGYLISPKTQMFHELPPDSMDWEYYSYRRIEDSDGATFEVLTADPYAHYAHDKQNGYFWGEMIEGCHGPTLEDLGCNFARDVSVVFYRGKKIDTADRATFAHLGGPHCAYAADKSRVYYGEIDRIDVLEEADRGTFTVLNDFFASDCRRVYCGCVVLAGADPASFVIIPEPPVLYGDDKVVCSPYAKDSHHVYYFEKPLAGADPQSFQYLSELFTKDDHAVYYAGKLLAVADARTFVYFSDQQPRKYRGRWYDAEDKNNKYLECSPECEGIQERDRWE